MPNKFTYEISVIICTFNTKKLTCECLDRLKKSIELLDKPVEVIVVENGDDGTGKFLTEKYDWVKVVTPAHNLGFAKGNNLGIQKSSFKSKYYLFLNSDALVESDTLKKSLDFFENHKDCDVLGCKLLFDDLSFQPSAGYLPTPWSLSSLVLGIDLIPLINKFTKPIHPSNLDFFKADRKVGWVMGAYLFMKNEVIQKTTGFDESFFMYMEEVEWCRRIWDKGFNIWYTPTIEITHLDKASSKGDLEKIKKIYKLEIIGGMYFLKKYYSTISVLLTRLFIVIGLIMRVLVFSVNRNTLRRDAYLDTLKELI